MKKKRQGYGLSAIEKLRLYSGEMDENGCIPWEGDVSRYGYGRFRVTENGKYLRMLAHRVAYENVFGSIPDGLFVCHKCDNRKCINPHHLFLGTCADNNLDRHAKGRDAKGEGNGKAKLSELDVRKIIQSSLSCRKAAKVFGVDKTTISAIRRGMYWRHLWSAEVEQEYQKAIEPLARMVHGEAA